MLVTTKSSSVSLNGAEYLLPEMIEVSNKDCSTVVTKKTTMFRKEIRDAIKKGTFKATLGAVVQDYDLTTAVQIERTTLYGCTYRVKSPFFVVSVVSSQLYVLDDKIKKDIFLKVWENLSNLSKKEFQKMEVALTTKEQRKNAKKDHHIEALRKMEIKQCIVTNTLDRFSELCVVENERLNSTKFLTECEESK